MTTEMDDGTGCSERLDDGHLTNRSPRSVLNSLQSLLFEKTTESDLLRDVRLRLDHHARRDAVRNHDAGLFAISGLDHLELVLLETCNRFVPEAPSFQPTQNGCASPVL